jgi:meso-butanediol dehydrogenase/(S,S)-butanediol dehydrogenase/diacetyl reductase
MELMDRTALVTGAARGIGRGIALTLAAAGCNLALADLADSDALRSDLDETRRLVEAAGRRAIAVRTNVSNELDVRSLAAETERVFGPIDVLVNNAGIISRAPVVDLTVDEFRRVLDVNVIGTFLCCKTVAPGMVERGAGSMINISSIAGKQGSANIAHYAASKFAVIGFTQSLALELGPAGVRVNAVCPGFLETNMWSEVLAPPSGERSTREQMEELARRVPLRRIQTPADIGQAVVYLCQAENVTGEALVVSGGYLMD